MGGTDRDRLRSRVPRLCASASQAAEWHDLVVAVVADVGVTSPATIDATRDRAAGASVWWLFLFTGSLWLLLSIVIFRFDWTTVSSISILFGVVMLCAAFAELLGAFADHGWWRVARLALGAAFGVIGIVAFVHPGNTFAALAGVMSFYFIVKGIFDVAVKVHTYSNCSD